MLHYVMLYYTKFHRVTFILISNTLHYTMSPLCYPYFSSNYSTLHLHSCIHLPDNQAANRKGKDKKTGKKPKNKDKKML